MAISKPEEQKRRIETIAPNAESKTLEQFVRLSPVEINSSANIADEFIISESIAHVAVVTARLLDRALAVRLRKHGIPIGQWPFLLFLWADEKLTQRDLSRLMAIEESTVTNTINRMVRDGLLLKERSSDNLRENRLKLTHKARKLKNVVLPEATANVTRATAGMSRAEVFFLVSLLRKLQSNLLDEDVHPLNLD